MTKLQQSLEVIRKAAAGRNAAVLLSFGKDSMVMASLIREALLRGSGWFPKTHGFPLPVIWFRLPWFQHKYSFGYKVAKSWGMELHDWQPAHCGIKVKPELLELVSRYNFGEETMDLPINLCAPEDYPRRDFICGLNDYLLKPKSNLILMPWDVVFHGHKSSDVDQFEGHVPLNAQSTMIGGVRVVFPLRDWTDDDVWDYIEENHVPVQATRYKDRGEVTDKWHNPDYLHACTRCIDPRNTSKMVYCPKMGVGIANIGNRVLKLEGLPGYVGEED